MKVLLSLLALLWPLAVYAGSSTITTKDASGSTKTFVVTTDGSGQFIAQSVTCDGTAAAQCAAVKAASTASGAIDPALVVSLSPNSPLVGFKDSGGTDMTDTTNHALKVVGVGLSDDSSISGKTGSGIMGKVEATAGTVTDGASAWLGLTTKRAVRADKYSWAGTALGAPANFGTSPGSVVAGSVNASVMFGTAASVDDPCKTTAKTTLAIDQAADTQVISGAASKKTYICSLALIAAAAETVSVVVGTGTVCATSIVAMLGSTTDSQGVSLAANGGLTWGNGDATIFGGLGSNADNVCIRQGGTSRIAGSLTYVQK